MPSAVTAAFKRIPLASGALCVLAIAGCGEVPEGATVERSDSQAAQLRERLLRGQGAS